MASSGFSSTRRIAQLDAFAFETLATPPISAAGIFRAERREQFRQTPVRWMEEKILVCFTWPAIMTSLIPSPLDFDKLAQLGRGDPVNLAGDAFDFTGSFLLDGDGHHVVSEGRGCLESK